VIAEWTCPEGAFKLRQGPAFVFSGVLLERMVAAKQGDDA
jgi:hypothetical protein